MGRVWDTVLKPNLKIVLLAYADAAEHDGTQIWPGHEAVERMTSYSRQQVTRITSELLERRILVQVDRGFTGQRASYFIDLSHEVFTVTQSESQSLVESDSPGAESDSPGAEELLTHESPPVLSRPSTPVLKGDKPPHRDTLWESFVEIHGEPAHKNERGKFGRYVSMLREAGVDADEYRNLVAAYMAKYDDLQPAVATVVNRIGEMRHFLANGPVKKTEFHVHNFVGNGAWGSMCECGVRKDQAG